MRYSLPVTCLIGLLLIAGLPLVASAQTQHGAIKAVKIEGQVLKLLADGSTKALAEGELLTESDTVVTGAEAGVVLVFMNGSSVRLAANSRLAIEEFKMDPLAKDIDVAGLTAEPSISKTSLKLAYGEMIGNVRKLNHASSYSVKTPVGAAGIRGTTFQIIMRPDATGQAYTFQLSTAEGVVVFSGTVPAGVTGTSVAVAAGTQVSATATLNPTTNAVTVTNVTAPVTLSPEATQQINAAVTGAIQQAQQSTNFSTSDQQKAATTPTGTTGTTDTTEVKSTSTTTTTTTTPSTSTPPTVLDPSTISASGT